jgi:hypothetical protein
LQQDKPQLLLTFQPSFWPQWRGEWSALDVVPFGGLVSSGKRQYLRIAALWVRELTVNGRRASFFFCLSFALSKLHSFDSPILSSLMSTVSWRLTSALSKIARWRPSIRKTLPVSGNQAVLQVRDQPRSFPFRLNQSPKLAGSLTGPIPHPLLSLSSVVPVDTLPPFSSQCTGYQWTGQTYFIHFDLALFNTAFVGVCIVSIDYPFSIVSLLSRLMFNLYWDETRCQSLPLPHRIFAVRDGGRI